MSTASHASDNAGLQALGKKHTAGAYYVSTVIAGLIGFYGIGLAIVGICVYN